MKLVKATAIILAFQIPLDVLKQLLNTLEPGLE